MQVSKPELEQMAKDGKGRASVIKYLAEQALQGSPAKLELDPETRKQMAVAIEQMVENWPNTLENIFQMARNNVQWHGDSGLWWRQFRNWLPAAAREICK